MGIGLSQIKHVKLPASDLRHSVSWYRSLFDLELIAEFFEDDDVRGVQLLDRGAGFEIALRQTEYCAGPPRLAGFEIVALRAPDEAVVDAVAARCDRLGVAHTAIMRIPGYVTGMDIPDPDGTVIRILWHDPFGMSGFLGVEYDAAGRPNRYREPRIGAPDRSE
jgi:catechol 2,3-dioxygenase-like lactoylglutathione lyase family enzyme